MDNIYYAYITTIKNLRKHSNADRLQCCEIFGNNVIVDLSYHTGDKVVYFPTDGQLSAEFAEENNLVRRKDENGNNIGGYLDSDKRNIRALKLRGEQSDGLVLPIAVLGKYTNVDDLKDGDRISILNGKEICKKYIPQTRHVSRGHPQINVSRNKKEEKRGKKIVSYPFFSEHIDTEQLAYNQHAFKEGDIVYITRKLHGTSFRVGNCLECTSAKRNWFARKILHRHDKVTTKFTTISGTRRVILKSYDGGYYGNNAFRKKYNDFFADKLPKGMTVYGEIVGWVDEYTPIMPKCSNDKVKDKEFSRKYGTETIFTYGCEPGENKCFIYRITMTNEDGVTIELPTEETMKWCVRLGCDYVPILERFFYTTWEDLNDRCEKYLDMPEPLANGSHITEGVVVRIDNRSKFAAYKAKGFNFKVLEGIIKDEVDEPDLEESEELFTGDKNKDNYEIYGEELDIKRALKTLEKYRTRGRISTHSR